MERFNFYVYSNLKTIYTAESLIYEGKCIYIIMWQSEDSEMKGVIHDSATVEQLLNEKIWIKIEPSKEVIFDEVIFDEVKVGDTYRVIPKRESYYGMCSDIIALEGEEVTVYEFGRYGEDIFIKSKESSHVVRCENLEKI